MAIDVFYVRHGEIEAKVPGDPGLSPAGAAMAEQAGWALAPWLPVAVVSSPLARAADTATAVATACGLEPSLDARLRERLNWGDVSGQPFDEFVELWERCTADRHHVPAVSGGRSACKAGCAAVELIDDVVITCGGGPIVVVAHGGLLVDLLLCLRDTDRAGPIDPAVDVAYCSITHLRWDKDRVEVRSLASTTHLDQVRTTRVD